MSDYVILAVDDEVYDQLSSPLESRTRREAGAGNRGSRHVLFTLPLKDSPESTEKPVSEGQAVSTEKPTSAGQPVSAEQPVSTEDRVESQDEIQVDDSGDDHNDPRQVHDVRYEHRKTRSMSPNEELRTELANPNDEVSFTS